MIVAMRARWLVPVLSALILTLPLSADEKPEKPKQEPAQKKFSPEIEKFLDSQPLLKARVGDEVVYRVQFKLPWHTGKATQTHRTVQVGEKEIAIQVVDQGTAGKPPTRKSSTIARDIRLRNIPVETAPKSAMSLRLQWRIVSVAREKLLLFTREHDTWRVTMTGRASRGGMTVEVTGDYWFGKDVPYVGLVKSRVSSSMRQASGGTMKSSATMLLLKFKRGDGTGPGADKAARTGPR